jgi:nucleoside-diphosphate-sugar epimerase
VSTPRVAVVTGGSGYLGRVLVPQLLEDPELALDEVVVFDLTPPRPQPRVRHVRGDVRDADALRDVVAGALVVFHLAAILDWGQAPEATIEAVNVGGTDNVLAACRDAGVAALVFTSSIDAVYGGVEVVGGDETLPYPEAFPGAYGRTKAAAEGLVLAADGDGLRTTVIRPCCIFGEGDPLHIGNLVDLADKGQLITVGDGSAKAQFTYVGNVAHLHVVAARSLLGDGRAGGEVYFALDFPAENFFTFLAPFVEATGHSMPSWSLPRGPLYALGAVMEGVAALVRPLVAFHPVITRFSVDFVTKSFTIDSTKATDHLGYTPRYDRDEVVARTTAWWRDRPVTGDR